MLGAERFPLARDVAPLVAPLAAEAVAQRAPPVHTALAALVARQCASAAPAPVRSTMATLGSLHAAALLVRARLARARSTGRAHVHAHAHARSRRCRSSSSSLAPRYCPPRPARPSPAPHRDGSLADGAHTGLRAAELLPRGPQAGPRRRGARVRGGRRGGRCAGRAGRAGRLARVGAGPPPPRRNCAVRCATARAATLTVRDRATGVPVELVESAPMVLGYNVPLLTELLRGPAELAVALQHVWRPCGALPD